jgi:hypothetical protein
MSKPTREQKLERIEDLLNGWDDSRGKTLDEIDKAILSDYDDLTLEGWVELYDRRTFLSYRINDVEETMDAPLTRAEDKGWLSMELDMLNTWIAEIDAELEGTDG